MPDPDPLDLVTVFNLATGPVQIQVERRDEPQAKEALRDVQD